MPSEVITLHNLPPLTTPFVGRKTDIADILARLVDPGCRLLTLVGAGGTGKTRLAIETLQHLDAYKFRHGAFYVPLAPLTSPDNIVPTIINVLGIVVGNDGSPTDELITFLQQRQLLLVMDNFEHVLDGVDIVADILSSAHDVTVLATSREVLNLTMEHIWHVQGMGYPQVDDPADINQYDALNLFIERAMQVRPDFAPGDEQANIIRICQLVAGLPLGIELAAGWLKTLSPAHIIQHIERGIDILATRARNVPDRHRSIRAVFDHSWQLLSSDEQAVFRRLSVFRGGFTLEAAKEVAAADLIVLAGLIEKSMIWRDAAGRYDIHELLRQYGEDQLKRTNEYQSHCEAHLEYFSRFVADCVPELQGRDQIGALDEIRADFENILTAWQYGGQHNLFGPLNLMLEGLQVYFEIIRYPPISNEMYRSLLDRLEPLDDTEAHRLLHRVKVFFWYVQFRQRKLLYTGQQLSDEIHESMRIAEEHEDRLIAFLCLIMMNLTPKKHPYNPAIGDLLNKGKSLGTYYYSWALDQICYYLTIGLNDNSKTTETILNEYLEVAKSLDDTNGIATAYSHLAQHTRFWGNIDDALRYYQLAIDGFSKTRNVQAIATYSSLSILMQLKKGQFQNVISLMPYQFEQLNRFGWFANHRYMTMVVAKAEVLQGNHRRTHELIKQIATFPTDVRPRTVFHLHELHIMYGITINDYELVRQYLGQALEIESSVIAVRLKLDFLPLVAFYYRHEHQFTDAVQLMSLTFTHPLSTIEWMDKWDLLRHLREELQNVLDSAAFQSAWEHGTQLDVENVLNDIRQQLGILTQTMMNLNH